MEQRRTRRNRLDGAVIPKTYSVPRDLADAVIATARDEGHNNQSTIVIKALVDYLNRRHDVRAA